MINNSSRKKKDDHLLTAAVLSKLEAGNLKAALQILCSDDKPAAPSDETLRALRGKHPEPATNRHTPVDPTGNTRFTPLQVDPEDIKRSLRTFPLGSSGGPDGLTLQHITDMLAGDNDGRLLNAITDLVNLLLTGKFDKEINTIIYGSRLPAISKKDGGSRLIAAGYVLCRLAVKCTTKYVINVSK